MGLRRIANRRLFLRLSNPKFVAPNPQLVGPGLGASLLLVDGLMRRLPVTAGSNERSSSTEAYYSLKRNPVTVFGPEVASTARNIARQSAKRSRAILAPQ
jgi:hypothetical protein